MKRNKGTEFPPRLIFFDTETTPVKISDHKTRHDLRLGCAVYWQRPAPRRPEREVWLEFRDADALWDFVEQHAYKGERLVVVAHNLAFDGTVTAAFPSLLARGWIVKALISERSLNIWRFVKDGRAIMFMDSLNLFRAPLADLGDVLGVPKLPIDFDTATDAELSAYCKRDVEILLALFRRYGDFLRRHDLGSFRPTIASQALGTYQHKYMKKPIYIHANPYATAIERRGYHGGRCECYFLGDLPDGTYYHLDVNSLYPHIMASTPVPWRLIGVRLDCEFGEFEDIIQKHTLIADVLLDTNVPAYPHVIEGRLTFPVGKFWTTLAGPELVHAWEGGRVLDVGEVALYDSAVLFADFVRDMYDLRLRYRRGRNQPFSAFCKYLMNSLYGKFGQMGRTWRRLGDAPPSDVWYDIGYCGDGTPYVERAIGGKHEALEVGGNSVNTFVAIPAVITSAGRLFLWDLLERAGVDHVFYCDTDSVLVDQEGYRALRGHVARGRVLGKLRLIQRVESGTIRGPKDYTFGNRTAMKGIRRTAEKLGEGRYKQDAFPSFRAILESGDLTEFVVKKQVKTLSREYSKGVLLPTGRVVPIRLET